MAETQYGTFHKRTSENEFLTSTDWVEFIDSNKSNSLSAKLKNILNSISSLNNYVTLDGAQSISGSKTFNLAINADILGNATTADRLKNDVSGTAGSGWQPCKIENGIIKYYNNLYTTLPASILSPSATTKSLTTVSSSTTVYVKLTTLKWNENGMLYVKVSGNCLEEHIYINFLGGNAKSNPIFGWTSTNSNNTPNLIVTPGESYNSDWILWLLIKKTTDASVSISKLWGNCTINSSDKFSETTTKPTGIEYPLIKGAFGNLSGNASTATNALNKNFYINGVDAEGIENTPTLTLYWPNHDWVDILFDGTVKMLKHTDNRTGDPVPLLVGKITTSEIVSSGNISGSLASIDSLTVGNLVIQGTSSLGTITSGTWNGSTIASTYLPTATASSLGVVKVGGTITSTTGYEACQIKDGIIYSKNTGSVTGVKVGNTSYSPSNGIISLPAYPTTAEAASKNAFWVTPNNGEGLIGINKISTNAGSIYLYSQNNTTGIRGIYSYNASGNGFGVINVDKDNNVKICEDKLTINKSNGNVTASGSFYANSDIRYKNILEYKHYTIENFSNLKVFNYTWKESEKIQIGTSAQDVEKIIPELITENKNIKSLDYAKLGAIGVIELSKEIVRLRKRIKELENKING